MDFVCYTIKRSNQVNYNHFHERLSYALSDGFTLLPDQIQALNPILVLLLIPLFNYIIYPLLAKFNLLTRPLQKMSCGMFISILAFLVSGFLQLAVEKGLTGKFFNYGFWDTFSSI